MQIECATCPMQETDHCGDCIVSYVAGRDPDDAVIIDATEERALRLLRAGGLLGEIVARTAVAG